MPPLLLPRTTPTAGTARAAPPTTAIVLPSLVAAATADTSAAAAAAYQHDVADQQLPANLCSQVGAGLALSSVFSFIHQLTT